jgi:rhodanese-related sulfurtransferase
VVVPTPVDRDRVRDLLVQGALLVEVLPAQEYDDERISGARNIPLRQLTAETVAGLDLSRPVIVYCWDSL